MINLAWVEYGFDKHICYLYVKKEIAKVFFLPCSILHRLKEDHDNCTQVLKEAALQLTMTPVAPPGLMSVVWIFVIIHKIIIYLCRIAILSLPLSFNVTSDILVHTNNFSYSFSLLLTK